MKAIMLAGGSLAFQLATPTYAEAKGRKSYTIIYRLNGGTNPKKQVKRVRRGKTIAISKLKKPKKKGYTFVNWYSNKRLTKKARTVSGRARKSERTVYAKWKPTKYSITYYLNGGKATRTLPKRYTIESKRITPAAPAREGREFVGWYSNKALTKIRPYIETGSTGNVKLYAKWKLAKYNIAYELYGGTATIALPRTYTIKSSTITPFAPSKDGQRFLGWYADPGFTVSKSSIESGSTGDVALYAKWTPTTYWDSHLERQCAKVNELRKTVGDDLISFVFVTDMHLPSNALVSPDLMRRAIRKTGASMAVFGGDAINAATEKNDAMGMLGFIRSSFPGTEVHMVHGNHDANGEGSTRDDYPRITNEEFALLTAGDREIRTAGATYFYRDDVSRKVRYLFLDSGAPNSDYIRDEQLAWMESRILELGENWTVLVFVHQFFQGGSSSNPDYDKNGTLIKGRIDGVFDRAKADIAGVISGHCHRDIGTMAAKGYPMVSTTCDSNRNVTGTRALTRETGTTGEQAFDIVSLDLKDHKLHFTRVGAGSDRVYSYVTKQVDEPVEEPVEEPSQDPSNGTSPHADLQAGGM